MKVKSKDASPYAFTPVLRRYRGRIRKKLLFILLLLFLAFGLLSIGVMSPLILSMLPMTSVSEGPGVGGISRSPVYFVRAAIVNFRNFYAVFVVWFLVWIRRKYSDPNDLPGRFMMVSTILFGVIFIILPFWFNVFPGGLSATRSYQIGWAFLIAGLLNSDSVRSVISGKWTGIASLIGGLTWWFIGYSGNVETILQNMLQNVLFWTVAITASYVLTFLGLLSPNAKIRWMAIVGLFLHQTFLVGTRMGRSLTVRILMDVRLRDPLETLTFLAWLTAIACMTGLMKRYGEAWLCQREEG